MVKQPEQQVDTLTKGTSFTSIAYNRGSRLPSEVYQLCARETVRQQRLLLRWSLLSMSRSATLATHFEKVVSKYNHSPNLKTCVTIKGF